MPLKLSMSISQDGNGEPIKLVKLFQVLFLNEFRQRTGGIVSVYTGIVFEGTFATRVDDPALIIGLSSEASEANACADLTSSFASQLNPFQTFWGKESHPVNNANSLRNEMARIKPEAAGERLTDFIDAATSARKPIFLLGDNDPGPLLAFPGQVDHNGRITLLRDLRPLIEGIINIFHCYVWLRQDLSCLGAAGSPYSLDFYWNLTFNVSSDCYDVSHFFVTERNYRVLSNRCALISKNGERNTYCGGGVKEISVQDQVKYFEEWLVQKVCNSAILEVKDKGWFRTNITCQMSVEMLLENQFFRQYILNKVSALGIFFGAFAAIGFDLNRIVESKQYFRSGIFGWPFLSETGVWFLMSAIVGLAFVRMFSPASTVPSRLMAWLCLCIYGIFAIIVFLLSDTARNYIMTTYHWMLYLPSLSVISGLLSLTLAQGELAERVKAWISQRLHGGRLLHRFVLLKFLSAAQVDVLKAKAVVTAVVMFPHINRSSRIVRAQSKAVTGRNRPGANPAM